LKFVFIEMLYTFAVPKKYIKNMKKVALLMLSAGMLAFVACGPSAEEKAASEKLIADSIAAVDAARVQDSIAQVEKMVNDSLAAVAKMAADSAAAQATADSIAAASKKAVKAVHKVAPKPSTPKTSVEKKDAETKDKLKNRFK
jgi:hypothetical protein